MVECHSYENKPIILKAIKLGYDVEIDIWVIDGAFYLGHDEPQYNVIFRLVI
jgi:hypothetical protein